MKKVLMIFFAIILTTPALIHAESFGPEYDKIVTFFQGQTEPEALDAIWESKTVFKVAVMDDGKSRDHYANYVCGILYNEGFRGQGVEVKIIDIEKLAYKNKWVTVGKAACE
ncbi:MAG: hypothetical protein DRH07_05240 [Deltaproteobacteria bacterium]|nr:MAG: hypothetical protein DRH07_05240 [Deltaproteobacteria bacterium]